MRNNIGFVTTVFGLLFLSTVLITATGGLLQNGGKRAEEDYYVQLEREYVNKMQEVLNTAGYVNSGVMLTKIIYEDNSREYHIAIHHCLFDSLNAGEKEALMEELKGCVFEKENCSFIYSLTGNA